jgi:hypothetical protein
VSSTGILLAALAGGLAGAFGALAGSLAGKRLSERWRRFLPVLTSTAAVAVVIPIGWALRGPAPSWVAVTSAEGGFRASFPAMPAPSTAYTGPSDAIAIHSLAASSGSLECVVAWSDYPEAIAGRSPDQVLDGARDGAAQKTHGRVSGESALTLAGYPGRAFKIEQENGWVYMRIALAGRRLYMASAATPAGLAEPAEVQTFLDSLTIER